MIISSIDTSGLGNDYTAICTLEINEKIKVINTWRMRGNDLNERIELIKNHLKIYSPYRVYIECNNMGVFYISALSDLFDVRSVATTRKSKPRMIDLIKYYLERQRLDLSEVRNDDLVKELIQYPNGKHDDLLMSLAVGIYGVCEDRLID